MKPHFTSAFSLALGLTMWAMNPAGAQQHRATHLGNPATRFAPPLANPEDLRARFTDPKLKPDIALILLQWGWRGDLEDPVEVGHEVTYDIKVTNQGTATCTNVRLICTFPESEEFVSGTGPTPVRAQGRTLTTEPLVSFAPKTAVTWRVIVKALAADDARFKVNLYADELERPIYEEEPTHLY